MKKEGIINVRYKVKIYKLEKSIPPNEEKDFREWLKHKVPEVGIGEHHEFYGYTDNYQDDIGVSFNVTLM